MIKLKGLKKKLLRLEASMRKDGKKLAKLKRRVETALTAESAPVARVEDMSRTARTSTLAVKKKSRLTAAGRDKLSALMKARWAAKRAGIAPTGVPQRVAA